MLNFFLYGVIRHDHHFYFHNFFSPIKISPVIFTIVFKYTIFYRLSICEEKYPIDNRNKENSDLKYPKNSLTF